MDLVPLDELSVTDSSRIRHAHRKTSAREVPTFRHMAPAKLLPAFIAAGIAAAAAGHAEASLTASPTAVTVPKTQISAPITVNLTFVSGVPGTMGTLSITGLPPGAVTVPSPVTYPTSPSQTSASTAFRIAVSAATAPGTYVIGITDPPPPTGRNAGFKNITLTVPPPSTLAASPSPVSVFPTQTSTLITVNISFPSSTSAGTVTLGFSGLPAGATTNPSTVSYTFLTGSTASSTTFRLATAAATPPGSYTITISDPAPPAGKGPSSTSVTLNVLSSSFSASVSPNPVTLTVGAAARTITVLTTVDPGFTNAITYSFSGFPSSVATGGSRVASSPYGPVTFPFSAAVGTAAGTYNGTLTGQSASGTKTFPMTVVVQQPDIGVSFGSPTTTVCNGPTAAGNSIQLAPLNGYAGTPQVAFASVPPGLSIAPSALVSGALPPAQAISFSVAASGATAGLHTLTLNVSDASAGINKSTAFPVTVTNPDFTPAVNPGSVTLQAGGGGQGLIASLAPINCFSPASVAISVIGAPAGITFTPPSATVTGPGYGPTTLTAQAGAAVAPTTYPVTFTFTPSSGAAKTVPASIVVTAASDFSLGATPNTINLTPGSSGTTSIRVTGLNGFTGNVDVSIPALTGVTFTPATFTLAAGAAQTVTAAAAAGAPTGAFPVTISGAGAPGTRSTGLTVVISAAPDFSLGTNPSSLTLTPGGTGTTTVSAAGLNGFSGTVAVTAPSLQNVTLTPAGFNVAAGGSLVVSAMVAPGTPPGTLSGLFSGTAAGITGTRTAPLTIVVVPPPDFSLAASPGALALVPGGSGTVTISATGLNGFSGSVDVSATPTPNLAISPSTFTLAAGASRIVTVAADPTAPMGTVPVAFTGNAAGVAGTRSASVNVTVAPGPDFSVSTFPSALTLAPGGAGTATVSAAGLNGFVGNVSVAASLAPNLTITPGAFTLVTGASRSVTIAAGAGAPAASATVTFTGAATGIPGTRSASLAVTVTSAPDFSLAARPARLDLTAGGSGTAVISATALNGFAGPISVSSQPIPNVSVLPASFTLIPGGTQSVTVTAAAGAPPTNAPLSLTFLGTAPGIPGVRPAGIEITIAPGPDFALAIDPASFALPPGGSASASLSVTAINGFTGTANVTAAPPQGITVVPNTFSVSANASQALTIRAGPNTPLGVFTISFSGTAPGVAGPRATTAEATVTAAPDFTLSVSPPHQTIAAGAGGTVHLSLTPANGFTATADVTATAPPGLELTPDHFLLAPARTQDVQVRAAPSAPPATLTLVFRATAPGVATPKTSSAQVTVTAPSPSFTVIGAPMSVQAAPGQAIAILYTFRSLTSVPLTIVADTLVRRSTGGTEFDRTDEVAGIALPPHGVATFSNTVVATAEHFARAGSPAIVIEDRIFRAAPDSSGLVATASAAVSISAVNSLLSTVSATRVSLIYPPTGTLVGRGDNLRAQGLLMGSGSGLLLVGWFFDGLLVETATVPIQNGTPTSVTTAVSIPTLLSGSHEISLSVLAPNTISSPPVQVLIEEGQKTLRLVSPAAGAPYLPGLNPPTFGWVPVPGIARYAVGLKRSDEAETKRRWFHTSESRWGPSARFWSELGDGRYEWVVRAYTGVGRSTLDRSSGGATPPPTSESNPEVAAGWTVTSAAGSFSIGDFSGLAPLTGSLSISNGVALFSWNEIPAARYLHVLYERSGNELKRLDLALLGAPARSLARDRLPRTDLYWRVIAFDRDGRAVGGSDLLPVAKGPGR